jgi:hypothetical protein
MEANTVYRKWLKNASRIGVCAMAAFMAIQNRQSSSMILDKFLGVSGALLGIPLILIIPTACHYRICAQTPA